MDRTLYAALAILVTAATTWLTRGLPYCLFGRKGKLPGQVRYLGGALPPAIMVILVAYCLRNVNIAGWPFGIPEVAALALTVLLHLRFKNTIVSITLGTILYMVLLRVM